MTNEELIRRDLTTLWHPCTQMKDHEAVPPIPIRRGQGVWLEDFEGRRYLDAISSWWVNLFGHGNPRIGAALKDQIDQLEHVLLAGFTHEPAVALAEQLCKLSPPGLTRCFYADNGSSAVEVALKMSFHFWQNQGQSKKTRFVALSNSYHGETLGALAVGDVALYKKTYKPLLMDVITVASPDCYGIPRTDWGQHSTEMFRHMEQTLTERADEICAVIIEPLVQCAGSMRMYDAVYLEMLREACTRHKVHLIADEIAVGFGRTGTLFACEQAGISPDFMCLSKGLTGGFLPLAAVLTTSDVYNAFYDSYTSQRAFLHSHSYTGNPLGCAAALATLDIFQNDNIIVKNRLLAEKMAMEAGMLRDHPNVAEIRQTGMILAIELVKNKDTAEPFQWTERRGLRAYRHALSKGVLLRPLGDVIYFMPPYVITPEEIELMMGMAAQAIDVACT